MHDARRQMTLGETFQKNFRVEAAHAFSNGQRRGEFQHRFVEKRRAEFQRGTHTRAVGFREQSFGERHLQIPALHAVEQFAAGGVVQLRKRSDATNRGQTSGSPV